MAQLIADVDEPAAAAASGIDLFVTGDKRVLSWNELQLTTSAMRIVSPREAWAIEAIKASILLTTGREAAITMMTKTNSGSVYWRDSA